MNDLFFVEAKTHDLGVAFGFGAGITCTGCEDVGHPLVPKRDEYYVFRPAEVETVIQYLDDPDGDALHLWGPKSSGKTSLLEQVCARLNWPVQMIGLNGRTEFADLVGGWRSVQKEPGTNPVMEFGYGVLPTAMKYGHVLLLNEVDMANPEELVGLNDIIEGRPLMIPETREVIHPSPMFRIAMTSNTNLGGDRTGDYIGTQSQNGSFKDRLVTKRIDYMESKLEENLLKRKWPDIDRSGYVSKMVRVATQVRAQYAGEVDLSSLSPEEKRQHKQLGETLSTRVLLRWAKYAIQNSPKDDPLKHALSLALTERCSSVDRIAIEKIADGILGSTWSQSWD